MQSIIPPNGVVDDQMINFAFSFMCSIKYNLNALFLEHNKQFET